jgi:YVTN family beta-propeller protein
MRQARSTCCIVLMALAIGALAGSAEAQPYVYSLGYAPSPDIITLRLLVINAATNTVVAAPLLGDTQGPRREHMAIAPDGQRIYVINNLEHTISVVSTRTHTVEETWPDDPLGLPSGVAVSADSRRLYLSRTSVINNVLQGALVVIDVVSRTRIATVPLGVASAYGVVASPDGTRVYVVASRPDAAVVVNTATNRVITTVPLRPATQSTTVTMSPDGRFAYFPRQATTSNTPGLVQVLDTPTNTIVATTTVGIGPWQVAASPNGATVYAASTAGSQSGEVHRLNPSTHAAEGATAAPSALGVAFLPNSARAYVAAGVNIFVMDTATHAVIRTIPVAVSHGGNNIAPGAAAIVATPPPFSAPGSTPSNLQATAISGNRVTLPGRRPRASRRPATLSKGA